MNEAREAWKKAEPPERGRNQRTVLDLRQRIKETISSSSPEYLEVLANCLGNFLEHHDVGEEDPVLLLECLPQMDLVSNGPAPGTNRTAVVKALSIYAHDIGELGVAFLFSSHDVLALAKQQLGDGNFAGNVQWAFIPGPGSLQATNRALAAAGHPPLPDPVPCANTRLVTYYSRATGVLEDDRCNFFTYY